MENKFLNKKAAALLLLLITINLCNETTAQVTQQWAAFYNSPANNSDETSAMTVDNSGNIYVTGISPAPGTGKDFATIKYNSAGVEQWAVRYNSFSYYPDEPRGIIADDQGNVYVTGVTALTGTHGVITTVKYNSAGTQLWAKRSGDSVIISTPSIYKSPIALDNAGNIYIGGSKKTSQTDNGSYLLIKYDPNGDTLWTRTYDGTQFLTGLGSGISVVKVLGNFVYVTGKSYDMNPNVTFVTTIKYDLNGTSQWIHKDTLVNGSDNVTAMETDPSGNIILTCNYGLDIAIFKYSPAGARLWKALYTGIAGDHYDEVTGLSVDPSGNIYLTGNSDRTVGDRDYLTLKYDVNGNLLWEKFYNASGNDGDYAKGICTDASGNSYITGITYETGFNFDYTTLKYDTDGNQIWKISYDGNNNHHRDEATAIALDPAGNVIVTGITDRAGSSEDFGTIKYTQTVGINQISSQIPEKFSLSQNYPNPFNPVTDLKFEIPEQGFVTLKIYDMQGKEVSVLVNSDLGAGSYKYNFNASGLTSGIYFYKLETRNGQAGDLSATKKMILLK